MGLSEQVREDLRVLFFVVVLGQLVYEFPVIRIVFCGLGVLLLAAVLAVWWSHFEDKEDV